MITDALQAYYDEDEDGPGQLDGPDGPDQNLAIAEPASEGQ